MDNEREWEDPERLQELINEEIAYVMGRISQREEARKQVRAAREAA